MNRATVRKVLDCASPLALLDRAYSRKRQRTGAVQDAEAAIGTASGSWPRLMFSGAAWQARLASMLLFVLGALALPAATYGPSAIKPPALPREFRGTWIATVRNIDWPSQPGLPVDTQKTELRSLLERAAQLRLNAVILQVRPAADAFYDSPLEPWSEYLTGQMGRAPKPFYDPLAFAVAEAHQRGLELHAWFNPFRARHASTLSAASARHVSRTRPHLVRPYAKYLWLDPGEKEARDYSVSVILDVVKRYDVDGVHLDDYFYPYPERDASGRSLPFPDWPTWKRYRDAGGHLERGDWRRQNTDQFVRSLYGAIKAEKPWIKFGISPFGIWRPGFPAQIRGFDAYDGLYADARKWFQQGWVDYLAPQLYWPIYPKEQSYTALLQWWAEQNPRARHLFIGNDITRLGPTRSVQEILDQLRLTRNHPRASGNIFWSMKILAQNRNGIGDALRRGPYAQLALPPASVWLDHSPPQTPRFSIVSTSTGPTIHWQPTGPEPVRWWALQLKREGAWSWELLPGGQTAKGMGRPAQAVALTAIDQFGNVSRAAVMELLTPAPPASSP